MVRRHKNLVNENKSCCGNPPNWRVYEDNCYNKIVRVTNNGAAIYENSYNGLFLG